MEIALRGLAGHVDALASSVELPTVIDAPQSAFLVATEKERRAAMRTERADHAHRASGIAERNQVLAERARPNRISVRERQLVRKQRRQPEPPQELAHRRSGPDPRQSFVLVGAQHAPN